MHTAIKDHQGLGPNHTEVNERDSEGRSAEWSWEQKFGHHIHKDDPIWIRYVELATAHDKEVIDAMSHSMDILLVFSGLFSAVVTTFIVQAEQYFESKPKESKPKESKPKESKPEGLIVFSFSENPVPYPKTTIILWYISLYCALLVAGGAVCMKQWLLEYRRSNGIHPRVPYHQAMHHRQTYANLRHWYVAEFGDLLGCVILLDLVIFFSGFLPRQPMWDNIIDIIYGDNILAYISALALAMYIAFLAFTTISVLLVSVSPYHTPISRLVRSSPQIFRPFVAKTKTRTALNLFVVTILLSGSATASLLGFRGYMLPPILMILVGFAGWKYRKLGQRLPGVGLFFTTLLGLAGVVSATLWTPLSGNTMVLPFMVVILFTLLVLALSQRYSRIKNQGSFPVTNLLVSAFTTFAALHILWTLTISPIPYAYLFIAPLILISSASLGAAYFYPQVPVDEITVETEALGWLIQQTNDLHILHHVLSGLPTIANTPFRRQILLASVLPTLASLIDSHIVAPGQTCLVGAWHGGRDRGDVDYEIKLMFYLVCLAEVSQMAVLYSRRLITPSYHGASLPPRHLQVNLKSLFHHRNHHIRALSQSIHPQLYPCDSGYFPMLDIFSDGSEKLDHSSSFAVLAELRMASTQIISWYCSSKALEPSDFRHYHRYCIASLGLYVSRRLSGNTNVFEGAVDLAYLLASTEIPNAVSEVTRTRSTPMKVARCIKELKKLDKEKAGRRGTLAGEESMLRSLAHSIISATDMYLKLFAQDVAGEEAVGRVETVDEVDIMTEMTHLDDALLEIGVSGRFPCLIDKVASALVLFYSIPGTAHISSCHLEPDGDPISLIKQLVLMGAPTAAPLERVGTLRAAGKILNKISDSSKAWSVAMMDGGPSLPFVINSMARDESPECCLAGLSALLDVHIFYPSSANFNGNTGTYSQVQEQNTTHLNLALQEISLTVLIGHTTHFRTLYKDLMADPSPLLKNIDTSQVSAGPLGKAIISKCITITSLLINSFPLEIFSPLLLQNCQYTRALASLASHSDMELVPISTRASAIHLFAHLWRFADQMRDLVGDQGTEQEDSFRGIAALGDIAKAVTIIVDQYASLDLECILTWVERLELISNTPQSVQAIAESGLVEALAEAILWAELDKPLEKVRREISVRLKELEKNIEVPTSRVELWFNIL